MIDMTLKESVYRFLQVSELKCAACGKELDGRKGYMKLDLHPQFFFFTWGWLKAFFGDHYILRFCSEAHFREFAAEGRLRELGRNPPPQVSPD
jgi:hypothetical protein